MTTAIIFSIILSAFLSPPASAYFEAGGFSFYANLTGFGNATVCISGTVPPNNYIGFGIPRARDHAFMMGSDISVLYGNASGVFLVHGLGKAMERPFFLADAHNQNSGPAYEALNTTLSFYNKTSNFLKACFTRPVNISAASSFGKNLTVGPYSYLWSTGEVQDDSPLFHKERGVVTDKDLFGLFPPKK